MVAVSDSSKTMMLDPSYGIRPKPCGDRKARALWERGARRQEPSQTSAGKPAELRDREQQAERLSLRGEQRQPRIQERDREPGPDPDLHGPVARARAIIQARMAVESAPPLGPSPRGSR
jgi:hypothetical protein